MLAKSGRADFCLSNEEYALFLHFALFFGVHCKWQFWARMDDFQVLQRVNANFRIGRRRKAQFRVPNN